MTIKCIFSILFTAIANFLYCQPGQYGIKTDIHYYSDSVNRSDDYINERCLLDVYYPKSQNKFSTIVWIPGGGIRLENDINKHIPEALKEKGLAVVSPNYRLYPKAGEPDYIEDAAAAVAWAFNNIEEFGGDSSLIFVSGMSSGGYLALMTVLDKRWLNKYNIDANRVAGLIPFSPHAITHWTVREERGIPRTRPIIDDLAPLYHVRPDAPPLLLITGDRDLEVTGRYEENAYLWRMMKVAGHTDTELFELEGYTHKMQPPAFPLLVKRVQRITKERLRKE